MKKIKKIALLIAVLMLMAVCFAFGVSAETWGDYEYTVLEDGTVEITTYNGTKTELVIPEEFDGKTVTSIDRFAFSGCFSLEYVYIPDNICHIDEAAFYYCINLEKVRLSNSISYIAPCAFAECFSLKEINIPKNVTIIDSCAFYDCLSLERIIIENANVTINDSVFHTYISSNGILSTDEWIEKLIEIFNEAFRYPEKQERLEAELLKFTIVEETDVVLPKVGIYCHDYGVIYSAENYAAEEGIYFEYCHFYADEWTYDYDNMIRIRKCSHCDEIETEKLESSEIPDEPGNPVDPDTPETPECDCICHETGFLNRILAIVYKIFLKLLDTSPLCECGVAHY